MWHGRITLSSRFLSLYIHTSSNYIVLSISACYCMRQLPLWKVHHHNKAIKGYRLTVNEKVKEEI